MYPITFFIQSTCIASLLLSSPFRSSSSFFDPWSSAESSAVPVLLPSLILQISLLTLFLTWKKLFFSKKIFASPMLVKKVNRVCERRVKWGSSLRRRCNSSVVTSSNLWNSFWIRYYFPFSGFKSLGRFSAHCSIGGAFCQCATFTSHSVHPHKIIYFGQFLIFFHNFWIWLNLAHFFILTIQILEIIFELTKSLIEIKSVSNYATSVNRRKRLGKLGCLRFASRFNTFSDIEKFKLSLLVKLSIIIRKS